MSMDNAVLVDIATLFERVPAVDSLDPSSAIHPEGNTDVIEFALTLWEDEFFEQEAFTDEGPVQPPTSAKRDQLEAILNAYISGVHITIRPCADPDADETHRVRVEAAPSWNPVTRGTRWLRSLYWKYRVWNRDTHVDITPLPPHAVGYHR